VQKIPVSNDFGKINRLLLPDNSTIKKIFQKMGGCGGFWCVVSVRVMGRVGFDSDEGTGYGGS
jgi:hypothetical protein